MRTESLVGTIVLFQRVFIAMGDEPRVVPPSAPSHDVTIKSDPRVALKAGPNETGAGNQSALSPGLYSTEPYSMLVYVPPASDPKIFAGPATPGPRMRIIQPELRLVPRNR